MHNLVSTNSQNRRTKNPFRLRIDQDFHEALRLTAFFGACDPGHRTLSDERLSAQRPHLTLGHARPPEWWINVESVGRDAVRDLTRVVVEQVGDENLVIVIGSVGKRPSTVHVSGRPDVRNVGSQLIIYGDETALVCFNPRRVET